MERGPITTEISTAIGIKIISPQEKNIEVFLFFSILCWRNKMKEKVKSRKKKNEKFNDVKKKKSRNERKKLKEIKWRKNVKSRLDKEKREWRYEIKSRKERETTNEEGIKKRRKKIKMSK